MTIFLLLLLSTATLPAQLCEGNLGNNIFTDGDFGNGTDNVIQSDPGIAPGYTYQGQQSTPFDGSYVITNNTEGWGFHFDSWLTLSDNSNDPNGYFMLVNASFDTGVFYSNQVTGLCENTFYQFSADIINVIKQGIPDHIFPNVSFLLDDVVVFSTGDILQNESWNKYGFTFTTDPGQTELKLSLRNNANGGNGNDLALDNIQFQPCGPDAFVTADQSIFLCEDDNQPTEITADISQGNQTIIWQTSRDSLTWTDIPGANTYTIFHDNFEIGQYYYRYISANSTIEIVNDFCRIISDVLLVEVLALDYSISDTICSGETYELGAQQIDNPGTYTESFISSVGCDSIVTLDLVVLEPEELNVTFNPVDPLCHNDSNGSLEINISDGLLGPYTFTANDLPTTENPIEGLAAGNYTIGIIDQNSCTSTYEVTLNNPPEFILTLPPDTIINLGEPLAVTVSANQNIQEYTWSTDELLPYTNSLSFSYTPILSQTHIALATNDNGCTAVENFTVTIDIDDIDIYFPNIIDPNSTSGNRRFTIGSKPNLITEVVRASIYDRWGNLVSNNQNTTDLNLWDGRINGQKAVAGAYVYLVELRLLDGNSYEFSGSLTLIR